MHVLFAGFPNPAFFLKMSKRRETLCDNLIVDQDSITRLDDSGKSPMYFADTRQKTAFGELGKHNCSGVGE